MSAAPNGKRDGKAEPEGHARPSEEHASWRSVLSEAAYHVLFKAATEIPWSSPLFREKRPGTYLCAACLTPLFEASQKRLSSTGWPTFAAPLPGAVEARRETRGVTQRIEYRCGTCGGHQGHLRRDLPWLWRLMWCNNGLALRFVPEGEALPPRRPRPEPDAGTRAE